MLNPQGYSIITEPGKRDVEHDTFTCGHCGFITFTEGGIGKPPTVVVIKGDNSVEVKEVGRCFKCWRFICPRCERTPFECTPVEAKVEAEEKAARLILP